MCKIRVISSGWHLIGCECNRLNLTYTALFPSEWRVAVKRRRADVCNAKGVPEAARKPRSNRRPRRKPEKSGLTHLPAYLKSTTPHFKIYIKWAEPPSSHFNNLFPTFPPSSYSFPTLSIMSMSMSSETPRPKDVGILAMEMYFPRRVSITALSKGWSLNQVSCVTVHL